MDVSAETNTTSLADQCRRASQAAVSRVATRPPVSQSLAMVTAAAIDSSLIGGRCGVCRVHVGSMSDDPSECARYLVEVEEAAEANGFTVSTLPALEVMGSNVYATVLLEW